LEKLGYAHASYTAKGTLSVSSARSTNPFQANRCAGKVAAASRAIVAKCHKLFVLSHGSFVGESASVAEHRSNGW